MLLQLAFKDGTNNKLQQPLGNWYQSWISQAWNQVFSPAEHKIYSFEMEPWWMDDASLWTTVHLLIPLVVLSAIISNADVSNQCSPCIR
jgi:hypothetical protein